jgi:hypothetical protein
MSAIGNRARQAANPAPAFLRQLDGGYHQAFHEPAFQWLAAAAFKLGA